MKKSFGFLFVLVLMLGCVFLLTPDAWAATEGDYTYTVIKEKATITRYNGSKNGEITIPATLGGYPVEGMQASLFENCTGLTGVTIPSSVTYIGQAAFKNCTNLTKVTFGKNSQLISIDKSAFYNCTGLLSITIPSSVKIIDNYAFYSCTSLTGVTFEENSQLTSIGKSAFYKCAGLTRIDIPAGLGSIDESAFGSCPNLSGVYITDLAAWCEIVLRGNYSSPLNVSNLYLNNQLVENLVIPDGVDNIGQFVFCNNTHLKSVTIPAGVTAIGNSAFSGCTNITGVTFAKDSQLTDIGENAFMDCSSLKGITLPKGLENIGSMAFYGCESLTGITIPSGVTYIDLYTFDGCTGLTNVTLSPGMEVIGENAFSYCENLTGITIPSTVKEIRDYAFAGCRNLTDVYITDVAAWCGITFGYYASPFTFAGVNARLYVNNQLTEDLVIPEGITTIPQHAFYGHAGFKTITIPSGVTRIGYRAFSTSYEVLTGVYITDLAAWCRITFENESANPINSNTNLYVNNKLVKDLVIPGGVTTIGNYAFLNYTKITSVTIPGSVTTIGESAFRGCSSLTDVYYDSTEEKWKNVIIGSSNTSLENATIHFSESSDVCGKELTWTLSPTGILNIRGKGDMYCYKNEKAPWYPIRGKIVKVVLGSEVTSIGDYAFENCLNMTSASISLSVTQIGEGAFYGCNSLSSVTIPEGVKAISDSTFRECFSLRSITIPYTVGSIGNYAFTNCSSLESISIPDAVSFIGTGAFAGCKSLNSITLSAGITAISDDTFWGCTSLTGITIPDGVTVIGYNAFENCTNLRDITIPSSVTSVYSDAFIGVAGPTNVYITDMAAWCKLRFASTYSSPLSPSGNLYLNNQLVENLVIPKGVTYIGNMGFAGCTSLKSVTFPSGVTQIFSSAFAGCTGLKSIAIPSGVTALWLCTFEGCTGLTSVSIPASVTDIDTMVFKDCTGLTSVTFEGKSQLADIGDYAFESCTSLKTIGIPSGVTTIGEGAFIGCSSLTGITIPSSVTQIGDGAFIMCASLANVTLSSGLTSVGDSMFVGCTGLTEVIIPAGVTAIYDYAFAGCSSLVRVTIPSGVTAVNEYAFVGCESLTDVYYDGTRTQWNAISIGSNNEPLKDSTVHFAGELPEITDLTIVNQPKDAVALLGGSATFTVSAKGSGLTYQWKYKNPTATGFTNSGIAGSKTPSLTVSNLHNGHNGRQYLCVIKDASGNTVETVAVTLQVAYIVTDAKNQSAEVDKNAIFSVQFSMTEGVAYQWQYKGNTASSQWVNTSMAGNKTNTLTVPAIATRNGYRYRCKITVAGLAEPIYSKEVTLTVTEKTSGITSQPKSITARVGDTVTFSVAAEGAVSYKWQYKNATATSWSNTGLTGYNTDTLTVANVNGANHNGRQYRCIITDANGNTVTSDPATLTVIYMINDAKSQSAKISENAVFTVNHSDPGATYRWQYKGNTASSTWANTSATGNKTPQLTVAAKATNNRYMYRCNITLSDGTVITSKEVYLNVVEDPAEVTANPTDASAVCGDYATFTVKAEGDGLSYQWQFYNPAVGVWTNTKGSGYSTNTLRVKTNNFNSGYQYRCVVKTPNGSGWTKVYSEAATLTVLPAAEIQEPLPETITAKVGDTIQIHIGAEGEGLTYQWQWAKFKGNWKNTSLTGATTDTLTVKDIRADMNGRYYRVVITNQFGGYVETAAVQLFVE